MRTAFAENAQRMVATYWPGTICVPASLDAALHTLDVPEDFYPENDALFRRAQEIADREERMDLNEEYTRRLILATFGETAPDDVLGANRCAVYLLKADQGNPFDPACVDEQDIEWESPAVGHDDLEAYIADIEGDTGADKAVRRAREDSTRHLFVATRLLDDHRFTLNYEIKGNHQIGLRRENADEYYFVDTGKAKDGQLHKDGPFTLREVCGITEQEWSRRPEKWPALNHRDLPYLWIAQEGLSAIMHIFPPDAPAPSHQ